MKRLYWLVFAGLVFSGCAGFGAAGSRGVTLKEDLAKDRVADLSTMRKLVGRKEYLFFSLPEYQNFLEGYIRGVITDYEDNPIEGVVVRAVPGGESSTKGKKQQFESSAFDPGISDPNGVYRIRFSLPLVHDHVDVEGKLLYNPGWEQQQTKLGRAYEPQMKESPFRLFYDGDWGVVSFAEGVRKLIVKPTLLPQTVAPLPGAAPTQPGDKKTEEPKKETKPKEDDFFKGFGMEQ